jgi:hypothetical protein
MKNEEKLANMMDEIQISKEQINSIIEGCKNNDARQVSVKKLNHKRFRRIRKSAVAVAAAAAICLLVGGGTTYAVSQKSVIREFFKNDEQNEYVEDVFDERNQSVTIGDVTYTVEGVIYAKDTGSGYVAIKMNRKDGSAPNIEDASISDLPYEDQYENYSLYYVDNTCIALVSEVSFDDNVDFESRSMYTFLRKSQEEDGAYFYIKYQFFEEEVSDCELYIFSVEDLRKAAKNQTIDQLMEKTESISLLSDAVESETILSGRFECVINPISVKLSWEGESPDTITLYKKDGTSEPLLENRGIVLNKDNWAGDTLNTVTDDGEKTTSILCVTFDQVIPLEEIDYIDIDGEKIQ